MGTVKDRNGIGLTEAEDIKKRWQEYREELYKEPEISSRKFEIPREYFMQIWAK